MALDIDQIRRHFPILSRTIGGDPLVYLDSAATAQKPQAVIDAMAHFLETSNANAHRGMHVLAEEATVALEDARKTVQRFVNAHRPEEIIVTKSCTESINLVARSGGKAFLKRGDHVILTLLEHHSNVVPWLQLKEEIGIDIDWVDIDNDGHLQIGMLEDFLQAGHAKLLAITAQSNVLGVRPPLKDIIRKAHASNVLVLVDAAQSIAHMPTDVRDLDCDFLAFSGHKLYGPTGIGVLYGKRALLERMPPFLGGGMMIQNVTTEGFTTADIPAKFEAGTQPVAEAVGLQAAIDWLSQFSWSDIQAHEDELITHTCNILDAISGLHRLGPYQKKSLSPIPDSRFPLHGCVSFTIDGVHPHDLTEILGRQGICLRAGHHCTQPLHRRLGVAATTRLSVGIYNTNDEIDATIRVVREASSFLGSA